MEQQDYNSSITVNVTPEDAFNKIAQVADWWGADIEGDTQKLNDVFTIRFGTTAVAFKITEVVHNEKIVWLVTDCNLPWLTDKTEWKGTKIIWEITKEGNTTKIAMTHLGLLPGIECYNDCKSGWDFYIQQSLMQLLSTGTGKPQTPKNKR